MFRCPICSKQIPIKIENHLDLSLNCCIRAYLDNLKRQALKVVNL